MSSITSATHAAATSLTKVTATIVGNAGQVFSTSFAPASTKLPKAPPASILDPSHPNPVAFSTSDPIVLFIIQAAIIILLSRFLNFFLKRWFRQPAVIGEIIAGLLIGPSALGRVHGFTSHIFPAISIPYLSLIANIGLVFFLFLVGMEVDFTVFAKNYKKSASISFVGMIVPFALGAGVSKGLFDEFINVGAAEGRVKFGTFLLFVGTANAITAFPVLARILTEQRLLTDPVGVITLSAGVGNDVVGWILLALSIALVNASSGIVVLYIILCAIGWVLVLWFIARPLLVLACERTGSFGEKGPRQIVVGMVVMLVLISAWVTDRLGIHPIFGAFLTGLIVPHGIRHAITEKIEDLVVVLFLPLYFALSGLNTNLGLLANGRIWGWVFCVIFVAFFSKFISCGLMAKVNGMDWRESGAVGSLMACKGLVELIVLNVGYNAGILNAETFAMFVTMALVTTFVTTPLTIAFYPVSYRNRKRAQVEAAAGTPANTPPEDKSPFDSVLKLTSRYSVILEQFDHLPALFGFCKIIQAPLQFQQLSKSASSASMHKEDEALGARLTPEVQIDALRLIELTDRTSALIKAADDPVVLRDSDSLTQVFRTFASSAGIKSTSSVSIESPAAFPEVVATHAQEKSDEMIVLPWAVRNEQENNGVVAAYLPNPFESLFGKGKGKAFATASEGSVNYASFVRRVFAEATCNTSLFVDRGMGSSESGLDASLSGHSHIFFAFHGGSDDRTCLDLLVQLVARNCSLNATVLRVWPADETTPDDVASLAATKLDSRSTEVDGSTFANKDLTIHGRGATDTVYPTGTGVPSDTSDDIAFAQYFSASAPSDTLKDALSRITQTHVTSSQPLHLAISKARALASTLQASRTPLIILAGRGRLDARSHSKELAVFLKEHIDEVQIGIARSTEVRRSLGDAGTSFVVSGVGRAVWVVQKAGKGGKVKDV